MDVSQVFNVPLTDISVQPSNVRTDLTSQNSVEGIHELAENIRINGLLQPVVLRGIYGHPPYEVIVGQRRFLAHQHLQVGSIQATFSGTIGDMDALLLSLSENMCRQEMNYEDTANAITKLYEHYGNDERQVQAHTGFSIRMIRSFVKIEVQASEKVKQYLSTGRISMADAKRVIDASQGDHIKADLLADEIAAMTKYEKKRLVEAGTSNPNANAQDLINNARQPKLEETIILNLPRRIHNALASAAEAMSVDIEELTVNTIVSWLRLNDYLTD